MLLTISYFLFAAATVASLLEGMCKVGSIGGQAIAKLSDAVWGAGGDMLANLNINRYCDQTKDARKTTSALFACSVVMLVAQVLMLAATSAGKARLNAFHQLPTRNSKSTDEDLAAVELTTPPQPAASFQPYAPYPGYGQPYGVPSPQPLAQPWQPRAW